MDLPRIKCLRLAGCGSSGWPVAAEHPTDDDLRKMAERWVEYAAHQQSGEYFIHDFGFHRAGGRVPEIPILPTFMEMVSDGLLSTTPEGRWPAVI